MANSTIITGSWSPLDLVLPVVKEETTYGLWYVTDSGSIDGLNIDFSQGDWLIYIKNEDGSTNWYKQSGGVAVFDMNNSRNVPHEGVYTRFRLDNNGNIINADYISKDDLPKHTHTLDEIDSVGLDKKVQDIVEAMFKGPASSSVQFQYHPESKTITAEVNVDDYTIKRGDFGELYATNSGEGGGGGGSASEFTGTIKIEQVENLTDEIKRLEDSIKRNYIITNTNSGLTSKHGEGGTELEVKVDGYSIVINQFGELALGEGGGEGGSGSICGNHTHTTDQITDLYDYVYKMIQENRTDVPVESIPIDNETIIINDAGQLVAVAAAIQKHTHKMDDIVDLDKRKADTWASDQALQETTNDGQFNLNGKSIGYSINILNKGLKETTDRVSEIERIIQNVDAPVPNNVEFAEFNIFYSVCRDFIDVETNEEFQAGTSLYVDTNLFYPANEGELEIFIDNESKFKILFDDTTALINRGNFSMTSIQDPYMSNPLYKGFYKSMTIRYKIKDDAELDEGHHIFKIKHTYNGEEHYSPELPFQTYKRTNPVVEMESKTFPDNDVRVSGIKKYNGDGIVKFQPIVLNAYDKVFAPKNLLRYKAGADGEEIPLEVDHYYQGNAHFKEQTYQLEKGVNGSKMLNFTAESSDGSERHSNILTSYLFWDSTDVEQYRYTYDRDYIDQRPVTIGSQYFLKYDSEKPVKNYEMMIANNIGKLDRHDYSRYDGPDYSKHITDERGFVWANFMLPCEYLGNIKLSVKRADGRPFERNKNGTLSGVEIYASQTSDFTMPRDWVNINKPYKGYGSCEKFDLDFNALDLFRSTDDERYGTWGQRPYIDSGYLFLKVGTTTDIDLGELISSAKESIEKWKDK